MQPWENCKNPNFGPNSPPPPPPFPNFFMSFTSYSMFQCSKLSSYAISRKINEPNLQKMGQMGPILACLAQILAPNFFVGFTSTNN